jgi:hypothetical protein
MHESPEGNGFRKYPSPAIAQRTLTLFTHPKLDVLRSVFRGFGVFRGNLFRLIPAMTGTPGTSPRRSAPPGLSRNT